MIVWRILGMPHRVCLAAADNDAGMTIMDVDVPPGLGVPPHIHHNEDEVFTALDGEVTVTVRGLPAPVRLRPGGLLWAPRGVLHGFRNETAAPARLRLTLTPGAQAEQMFAALDAASHALDPADREQAAAVLFPICARFGVEFDGGPDRPG